MEENTEDTILNSAPSQNPRAEDFGVSGGTSLHGETERLFQLSETGLSIDTQRVSTTASRRRAAETINSRRHNSLMNSMAAYAGTDADKNAQMQRLGLQSGTDAITASHNLALVSQMAELRSMRQYEIASKYPILARQLSDPDFASIAHDDLKSLTTIERIFDAYNVGVIQSELGDLGHSVMLGEDTRETWGQIRNLEEKAAKLHHGRKGFLEEAATITGQMSKALPYAVGAGVSVGSTYAGVAALTGMEITVPAAFSAGFTHGSVPVFAYMAYKMEAGNAYIDMINSGYSRDAALWASAGVGAANAALELLGVWIAIKSYRMIFNRVVQDEVIKKAGKLIERPTTGRLLRDIGIGGLTGVAGETGTEFSQELVAIIGEEIARSYTPEELQSKFSTREGLEEIGSRIGDVVVATAKGMTVLGSFGMGVHGFYGAKRIAKSKREGQFFEALDKAVQESKLGGRSPNDLGLFIAGQARDGTDTIYFDAHELTDALAKLQLSDEQFDKVLPGVRAQIETAKQAGVTLKGFDVKISTADYAANAARTELNAVLKGHMRLSPDAVSAANLPAAIKEDEEQRAEFLKAAEELEKVNDATTESAQRVHDVIKAQLKAASPNMTDEDAEVSTLLHRARVVTAAARAGISPEEWHQKNRYTVTGADTATVSTSNTITEIDNAEMSGELQQAEASVEKPAGYADAVASRDAAASAATAKFKDLNDGVRRGSRAARVAVGRWEKENPEQAKLIESSLAASGQTKNAAVRGRQDALEKSRANAGVALTSLRDKIHERLTAGGWKLEHVSVFGSRYYFRERNGQWEQLRVSDHNLPHTPRDSGLVYATETQSGLEARPEADVFRTVDSLAQPEVLQQAAAIDAAYLAAVERGDMETAQRMVDEAATGRRRLDAWRDEASRLVEDAVGTTATAGSTANPAVLKQAAVRPVAAFYSAVERELQDIDAKSLTAAGWKERIQGLINKGAIKADEVYWSGLNDYLDGLPAGKIDRETILEFARVHGVKVSVVDATTARTMHGSDQQIRLAAIDMAREELSGSASAEVLRKVLPSFDSYRDLIESRVRTNDSIMAMETHEDAINDALSDVLDKQLDDFIDDIRENGIPGNGELRFGGYTTLGGKKYREILMTIPSTGDEDFTDTHWPLNKNVVVHVRGHDRIDADGKRVFFIDEIQSGWGQTGRDQGFMSDARREELNARHDALEEEVQLLESEIVKLDLRNDAMMNSALSAMGLKDYYLDITKADPDARAEFEQRYRKLKSELGSVERDQSEADARKRLGVVHGEMRDIKLALGDPIYAAPFVTTTSGWLNLALKQILIEAVNGGYDRVAFINGQQSADRYKLSHVASAIGWSELSGARREITVTTKSGSQLLMTVDERGTVTDSSATGDEDQFVGKHASKVLGKELADKIMGSPKGEVSGLDLDFGGEGMVEFYDVIVRAAIGKMVRRLSGDKLGTTTIKQGDEGPTTSQLSFDITEGLADAVTPGLPLFQAAPAGGARGTFDPRTLTTRLLQSADATTFLHETGHFFLDRLMEAASRPNASEFDKAEAQRILDWFGIKDVATWNAMSLDQKRIHHEAFAYNFEVYLFEGKSPSIEMRSAFEKFKAWLREVYTSIENIGKVYRKEFGVDLPVMTGEVRQVMDRLLATDEQIKRAEGQQAMMGAFQTQEQSGMDDARWAAYQEMLREAREMAVTDLTAASLKQMQWLSRAEGRLLKELQAKNEEKRAEIRAEVSAEVRAMPIYMAIQLLRKGEGRVLNGEYVTFEGKQIKLDAETVRGMIPKESMEKFGRLGSKYGMIAEGGASPELIAGMFGFTSGDELVLAILDAQPVNELIDARTDERMLAENGDMNTPEQLKDAVQKALHNEARGRFVAVELKFLANAVAPVRAMIAAAKQVARGIIGKKKIKDLRPHDHVAAEARAAKEAWTSVQAVQDADTASKSAYTREYNKQIAAGVDEVTAIGEATKAGTEASDRASARRQAHDEKHKGVSPAIAAIKAKQAEMLQHHLATAAMEAKESVVRGIKYLRNVLNDNSMKKIGAEHVDQITALLDRYELRKITQEEAARRKDIKTWVEAQRALGLEPEISPQMLNEANRQSYRDMTVDEFNDLVTTVKMIEHIGRNKSKVLADARAAEFTDKEAEIEASILANAGGKTNASRTTNNDKGVLTAIKGFFASHLKAGAVARILDGGKDNGPVWNYLMRTANAAGDRETSMRAEATKALTEILAPFFRGGKMGGAGKFFPSINKSLNRESVLAIALNCGNAGNLQRLLGGEKWTIEQIRPILESLTAEEAEAVQAIWDYVGSFRPMIAEKSRRLYGKEPEWVEPQELVINTSDGKVVKLAGGYYPIRYDPLATQSSQSQSEADAAKEQLRGAHVSSTTRRSFTKPRADEVHDKPLLYTLSALFGGVNEVIHDLSWHDWLIDANKLMRSEKVDQAIRRTHGPNTKDVLTKWIKDVAIGDSQMTSNGERALAFLRQNISAVGLGYKAMSAAMQITGFNHSIVRIGAKWVIRGLATSMSDPLRASREASEKSSFMRNRARTQFRELNELRNMVQGESSVQRNLRVNTYFMMMKMQRLVDVPTWWGAYEKALSVGEDEETSVALADQAVLDSQGGGQIKDLSEIERGGPATKLFTVFYGFMNTAFNMGAVAVMTPKSKGKLAADLVMLYIVPVVAGRLIRDALTPDDDDDKDYLSYISRQLIEDELSYLMGTMMIVREFDEVAKIVSGGEGYGYSGPSGLRAIGDVGKLAKQVRQWEFDRSFRQSAINVLGDFSGIPAGQINATIDGVSAVVEGETASPLAPVFGFKKVAK